MARGSSEQRQSVPGQQRRAVPLRGMILERAALRVQGAGGFEDLAPRAVQRHEATDIHLSHPTIGGNMSSPFMRKILIVVSGITALSTLPMIATAQSAPQAKTCLFYEHFDYAGEHFGLYEGDVLVTREDANSDVVHPGNGKRRFVSPEWANRVSAVKVPPNCTAYVSVGNGVGQYPTDMARFNDDTQDKGEAFGCKCN